MWPEHTRTVKRRWRGFSDLLGDRVVVESNNGMRSEGLILTTALGSAADAGSQLASAVSALVDIRHPALRPPRDVQRLSSAAGRPVLVSDYTPGVRLSAWLDARAGRPLATGSVLHIARQVAAGLRAIHEQGRESFHGALAMERVVLAPDGQLRVVEPGLGPLLAAQTNQDPGRWWDEFRIAVPFTPQVPAFGPATDGCQLALLVLELLLGRRLRPGEYPDGLALLLGTAEETDFIGDRTPLGSGLFEWLSLAFALDAARGAPTIDVVGEALDLLISDESGYVAVPLGLDIEAELLDEWPMPSADTESESVTPTVGSVVPDSECQADAECLVLGDRDLVPAPGSNDAGASGDGWAAHSNQAWSSPALEHTATPPPWLPPGAASAVAFDRTYETPASSDAIPEPFASTDASGISSSFASPRASGSVLSFDPRSESGRTTSPGIARRRNDTFLGAGADPSESGEFQIVDVSDTDALDFLPASNFTEYSPQSKSASRKAGSGPKAPKAKSPTSTAPASRLSATASASRSQAASPTTALTTSRWTRMLRWAAAAAAGALVTAGGAAAWIAWQQQQARADTAIVVVTSTPPGAAIVVDGIERGKAPVSVVVKPGSHEIVAKAATGTGKTTVELAGGAHEQVSVAIQAAGDVVGRVDVATDPAGTQVVLDGVERGRSPVVIEDVSPGEHVLVLEHGPVRFERRIMVAPAERLTLYVPLAGYVNVRSRIPVQVLDRGRLLGNSSAGRLVVPAGRRRLQFVNDQFGVNAEQDVVVVAGQVATVDLPLSSGTLSVSSDVPADVWVNGVPNGRTPTGNLTLPVGEHEIVVATPELGEQRLSVIVGLGAPTRLNVKLLDTSGPSRSRARPRSPSRRSAR